MADDNILEFAFSSLFIGLFVSGILTLATGGELLLNPTEGQMSYENMVSLFNTQTSASTPTEFLGGMIKSAENPLAFDIVLGMINVGSFLLKMLDFLVAILVNFFTISFWLLTGGVPSAITGIVVFMWQYWTFKHILAFIFKERITG